MQKRNLLIAGLLVAVLAIPLTVFYAQKQSEIRSRANADITYTIWPSTAVPSVVSHTDTKAVELGIKFQTTTAGVIKGIRFYKGPLNTGTHVGSLWSSTGTRLATATFTNETASGWQQVNFASPVAILPNTTYVASYFAPTGRYSLNTSFFSNAVVNGPIKALSNGESGGNGVYNYVSSSASTGVFPTSTFQASNYWVDIVFQSSTVITPQPTLAVCKDVPADISVVVDRSPSMNDKTSAGAAYTKIAGAKIAASNFVTLLAQNTQNRTDLITFHGSGRTDIPLTSSFGSVSSAINAISTSGTSGTCIECGIRLAAADIQASGRPGLKKVVVLLTDGRANFIYGSSSLQPIDLAEQKALDAALAARASNGIIFFTIGLGNDVNNDLLEQIATRTGGKYYFPPTPEALTAIYAEISQIIAQGSITGTIFNDANHNAIFDSGEEKLPNWTVHASSSNGDAGSAVSDENGNYFIAGLCDGTYAVKSVLQDGWLQTLPVNGQGYSASIVNGSSAIGKDFGFAAIPPTAIPTPQPTIDPCASSTSGSNPCVTPSVTPSATPAARCSDQIDNDSNGFADAKDSTCHTDGNPKNPSSYDPQKDGEHGGNTCADSIDNNGNGLIDGADPVCHTGGDPSAPWDPNLPEVNPGTTFNLELFLHGIGSSGDNANPTANSLSNKNPQHPVRNAVVSFFDSSNNLAGSGSVNVSYTGSESGSFRGVVTVNEQLASGLYTVKVRTPEHLTKLVPGIQTITAGANHVVPAIHLIAGDVINDNQLNILDYNALMDCYSDLAPAPACDAEKKLLADTNDDGNVNQFDYNLFIREVSVQAGN